MRMQTLFSAALCWSAACTAGCAMNQPSPPLGASVGLMLAQQVMDPGAGARRAPLSGIDGQAAKSGYDAYQKSYRAPQPQPNTFTIGVGGSGSGR